MRRISKNQNLNLEAVKIERKRKSSLIKDRRAKNIKGLKYNTEPL